MSPEIYRPQPEPDKKPTEAPKRVEERKPLPEEIARELPEKKEPAKETSPATLEALADIGLGDESPKETGSILAEMQSDPAESEAAQKNIVEEPAVFKEFEEKAQKEIAPKPISELAPSEHSRLAQELHHSGNLIRKESEQLDSNDPKLKELRLELVDIAEDYIMARLKRNINVSADQLMDYISKFSGLNVPFEEADIEQMRSHALGEMESDLEKTMEEHPEANLAIQKTMEEIKAKTLPEKPIAETPEEEAWFAEGEAMSAEAIAEEEVEVEEVVSEKPVAETPEEEAWFAEGETLAAEAEAKEAKITEQERTEQEAEDTNETMLDIGFGGSQMDHLKSQYNEVESFLQKADFLRNKPQPTGPEIKHIDRANIVQRSLGDTSWDDLVNPPKAGFFSNLFGGRKKARKKALEAIQDAINQKAR